MAAANRSAGIALVRGDGPTREVLLVHPGGPFWAKKDVGAWSLPKGMLDPGEDALTAAKREFAEEIGHPAPAGPYEPLGEITLKSGKKVIAFAARGDLDASTIKSNEIDIEWQGRTIRIPEVDRGEWVSLEKAKSLANPNQLPLIEKAFALKL